MTLSYAIRPATPADRAGILALVPRLRAFGPPPLRPADALDAGERRTIERFFTQPPTGTALWAAVAPDGRVVGAAYAEPATDYFTEERHGHLGILMVAEEAEGQGLGRALLATVEAWATTAGFRFLTLNVFATNERAAAVYDRAGYAPDTVRYVKELAPRASTRDDA